jgi:hypothetical protein
VLLNRFHAVSPGCAHLAHVIASWDHNTLCCLAGTHACSACIALLLLAVLPFVLFDRPLTFVSFWLQRCAVSFSVQPEDELPVDTVRTCLRPAFAEFIASGLIAFFLDWHANHAFFACFQDCSCSFLAAAV